MATPGTGEPPVMNPPSYQQYTSYPQNAHAPLTNYNNAYYLPPPQQLADDQQDVASDDGYNAPGIPKEYLNVSLAILANLHAKLTMYTFRVSD